MAVRTDEFRHSALLLGVVVAMAWPAIWLVWTPLGARIRVPDRPFAPDVVYVRQAVGTADLPFSPMLITFPSSAGAQDLRDDKPDLGSLSSDRSPGAAFLGYAPPSPAAGSAAEDSGRRMAAMWERSAPPALPGSVYGEVAGTNRDMVVEMSPALQACGFEPGKGLSDLAGRSLKGTVTAYVQVDDRGQVSHVFLDTPGDTAELNGGIVRALLQGRAARPAGACGGTVSISMRGRLAAPRPAPADAIP